MGGGRARFRVFNFVIVCAVWFCAAGLLSGFDGPIVFLGVLTSDFVVIFVATTRKQERWGSVYV